MYDTQLSPKTSNYDSWTLVQDLQEMYGQTSNGVLSHSWQERRIKGSWDDIYPMPPLIERNRQMAEQLQNQNYFLIMKGYENLIHSVTHISTLTPRITFPTPTLKLSGLDAFFFFEPER